VGNSLHDVFLVAAPIALAGFLIVMFLRERPLRGRASGQADASRGRASEQADASKRQHDAAGPQERVAA
jgi:hypothetical protein